MDDFFEDLSEQQLVTLMEIILEMTEIEQQHTAAEAMENAYT